MSYCNKECWYKDKEHSICGIPIGLKTLQHCECGKCIEQERKRGVGKHD